MLAQRIYGLALGYEDLNDHEQLRSDPLIGVLSGKRELEEPLAGKSTLNRLAWPKDTKAPTGAPNVLLVLLDDVGFGASSTFGGPIPMPIADRLAARGLRYTQFHTTALCSPTRSALLTGHNHHEEGFGVVSEISTGYPGYNSVMPDTTATVGEILKDNGYNTSWFGKNHNTPESEESVAGPYTQWPTGMGFEYFYGFMGGTPISGIPPSTRTPKL
jgi:arylsulfatase A-like enzyme